MDLEIVEPDGAVGDSDIRRIPSGTLSVLPQAYKLLRELMRSAHRVPGIGADRLPSVSQAGRPLEGPRALTAYPDGRMRLLPRPGLKGHIREADVLSLERGVVAGP